MFKNVELKVIWTLEGKAFRQFYIPSSSSNVSGVLLCFVFVSWVLLEWFYFQEAIEGQS